MVRHCLHVCPEGLPVCVLLGGGGHGEHVCQQGGEAGPGDEAGAVPHLVAGRHHLLLAGVQPAAHEDSNS